jgi:hypothetical protein
VNGNRKWREMKGKQRENRQRDEKKKDSKNNYRRIRKDRTELLKRK